jgi:hypothetical protein
VLPACRTNVANIASTKLSRPGIRNVHISTKLNHVATAFLCGVPFFPALSTHYALKTYGWCRYSSTHSNLGNGYKSDQRSMLWFLYPWGRLRYSENRWSGGPQHSWPESFWGKCMPLGWRERNQQDTTNLIFIIKLLSQHVSDIIIPIIRRTRVCTAAYGVLHCNKRGTSYVFVPLLLQCRTPYAAVNTLVLLMMGITMPETCWDRSLIINIRLVASCWFLSLHPTFMMHGHKSLKFVCPYRKPNHDYLLIQPVA